MNILNRRGAFLGLAIFVASLQTAALAYIVVARDSLLKHVREVVLNVEPVDPRDLFRGDYVTLNYAISQITPETMAPNSQVPADIETGSTFFAVLRFDTSKDTWNVARVSPRYPDGVTAEEAVIAGRAQRVMPDLRNTAERTNAASMIIARYGIEKYFVPEGTGRALEEKVRSKVIKAIIALGNDGTAALKGLIVDGERQELPPIF